MNQCTSSCVYSVYGAVQQHGFPLLANVRPHCFMITTAKKPAKYIPIVYTKLLSSTVCMKIASWNLICYSWESRGNFILIGRKQIMSQFCHTSTTAIYISYTSYTSTTAQYNLQLQVDNFVTLQQLQYTIFSHFNNCNTVRSRLSE